ncbi:FAD binding domain-containing protein [Lentzea californiensis]|uniref:FAD binding domain-containing protein n=1 Tax=Lentzea californiensis TaxID=438851 RepID=UPI00216409F8|nr:xanthine dehydrogenase family protein subunit M [Lentzea californiensis]MCR3747591.1 carbon-monoxide dehydrogenase medium subunit [Lentzea californiensis]
MIPAEFKYMFPSTVDEAVRMLAEEGEDAKVIAGGQSLVPVLRMRLAAPTALIDIGGLTELTGVRDDGDSLLIGAMTTHYEVQRDHLVQDHALLLRLVTDTIADPQIRHRGTFGGSLCHADPAGDLLAPVLALDAVMIIAGPSGRREVPAAEFFVDYFTTALAPDEILLDVRVPKYTGWGAHYEKLNRVAQAWSIVAVAAAVQVRDGAISAARVGLTNVGSGPLRATEVEAALVGQQASAEAISEAALRASSGDGYKDNLARVLTGRALTAAVAG